MLKLSLNDFVAQYPLFVQHYSMIDASKTSTPHDTACAEAGTLLLDFTAANEHAVAAKYFCTALGATIDAQDYPEVAVFCFGKAGAMPIVDGWATQISEQQVHADALKTWMKTQACSVPSTDQIAIKAQ
jgi:hypothetical protein